MMAFSMLCCTKPPALEGRLASSAFSLGRLGRHWLSLLFLLCAAPLWAAEIPISSAYMTPGDDGYQVNADFGLELSSTLEEMVNRGVPLYFVAEFELGHPRWYWLDETLVTKSRTWRLSYHALTRQYRLSSGALYQNFTTLADALRVLSRLRGWTVAEKGVLKSGSTYQAALRLRLDVQQLPKPFQLTALTSREWNFGSDWQRWSFTAGGQDK